MIPRRRGLVHGKQYPALDAAYESIQMFHPYSRAVIQLTLQDHLVKQQKKRTGIKPVQSPFPKTTPY
jgi:hypothetical protein